jgi:hypothetical protein
MSSANSNRAKAARYRICAFNPRSRILGCAVALSVLRVPATFESPVSCLMHGQAYLAQTSIGQSLNKAEAVKVMCVHARPVT